MEHLKRLGQRRSRLLATLLTLAGFVYVQQAWQHGKFWTATLVESRMSADESAMNSTLGFQHAYALALVEREDRRRPLQAAAIASDIDVTIINGIHDHEVPPAKVPANWTTAGIKKKNGELGCFMSHAMIWEKIVRQNTSSAMIVESDADWDIRVKQAMPGVVQGVRKVADWPFADIDESDKWDLLWLGYCGASVRSPRVYRYNDSTAPDDEHAWSPYIGRPGRQDWTDGERIVFQLQSSVCMISYAVSNRGARRLLDMLKDHHNIPIDMAVNEMCSNDRRLVCLGVWPPLFTSYKSESNLKKVGELTPSEQEKELELRQLNDKIIPGKGIQVSARVNAARGLTVHSPPSEWEWQWNDKEMKHMAKDE